MSPDDSVMEILLGGRMERPPGSEQQHSSATQSGADWITDEPDTKRSSGIEECKTASSEAGRTGVERRKRGGGREGQETP